jgi:quinol monooxygenase YgiN
MPPTSPTKTLTVVSVLEARPGKQPELRAALAGILKIGRREKGCLQYDLHESTESPGKFLFFETWQDQAAFDAHLRSQHIISLLRHINELCVEFPHGTFWRKL